MWNYQDPKTRSNTASTSWYHRLPHSMAMNGYWLLSHPFLAIIGYQLNGFHQWLKWMLSPPITRWSLRPCAPKSGDLSGAGATFVQAIWAIWAMRHEKVTRKILHDLTSENNASPMDSFLLLYWNMSETRLKSVLASMIYQNMHVDCMWCMYSTAISRFYSVSCTS